MTFDGEFHRVDDLVPSRVPCPPIWSGSMGPKSLAVTGRLADAWKPGGGYDWRSQYVQAGHRSRWHLGWVVRCGNGSTNSPPR
ncbi:MULTISPECIES: LLM class flavin-dependent oxidoreductase [Amycolatopsis]|uniref:Luciferase-like domain-containing protein n=1 Tax=Amycolatopsis dongchuanensis TaxID=1070866 RepID=A0ABP9QFX9_9PSEU|nr:LLM class flavin-dependent oxidoreductase [Amycolatopsis sacchari]